MSNKCGVGDGSTLIMLVVAKEEDSKCEAKV
jgi:hypothetical protein